MPATDRKRTGLALSGALIAAGLSPRRRRHRRRATDAPRRPHRSAAPKPSCRGSRSRRRKTSRSSASHLKPTSCSRGGSPRIWRIVPARRTPATRRPGSGPTRYTPRCSPSGAASRRSAATADSRARKREKSPFRALLVAIQPLCGASTRDGNAASAPSLVSAAARLRSPGAAVHWGGRHGPIHPDDDAQGAHHAARDDPDDRAS